MDRTKQQRSHSDLQYSKAQKGVPSIDSGRPSSEQLHQYGRSYKTPEAEAIDKWFEDLSYYERTLEQLARTRLDTTFRDELGAIEQWFSLLNDPEKTCTIYSMLKTSNQVQVRFFMTVLQQMLDGAVEPPEQRSRTNVSLNSTSNNTTNIPEERDFDRISIPTDPRDVEEIKKDEAKAALLRSTYPTPLDDAASKVYWAYSEKDALVESEFVADSLLATRPASIRSEIHSEIPLFAGNASVHSESAFVHTAPSTNQIPQLWTAPSIPLGDGSDDEGESKVHKEKGKIPESVDMELIKGLKF